MSAPKVNGLALIEAERVRQLVEHGYDVAHDDTHVGGEIARAAAVYAVNLPIFVKRDWPDESVSWLPLWPDDWEFKGAERRGHLGLLPGYASSTDERIRELTKAGALIAAELDRLLRMEGRQ